MAQLLTVSGDSVHSLNTLYGLSNQCDAHIAPTGIDSGMRSGEIADTQTVPWRIVRHHSLSPEPAPANKNPPQAG